MKQLNQFEYESPDGLKYYFNGRVISHAGIGLPPLKFIEDFGPNQKGSTVRDWRINPRTISFEIFLQGDYCCGTRGEQIAEIISTIRPNRGTSSSTPGWLRFLNDSVKKVEIPVYVLQGPSGDYEYNGEVGKWQVSDAVQFYAPDPIWRETEQVVIFTIPSTEQTACLDISCLGHDGEDDGDMCLVAETYLAKMFIVNYTGTWDGDQLAIRLHGPLNNPKITNITVDKTIELEYNIPDGDYIDITLTPEYVSVIDNNGNNLIGTVTSISDLVDFVIKSPGQITSDGTNRIIISGVDTSYNTAITLSYWVRHISAYGSPQC